MAINAAQVELQNAPRLLEAEEINRIITDTPKITKSLLLKNRAKLKDELNSEAIKSYIDWLCKVLSVSMPALQKKGIKLRKAVQKLVQKKSALTNVDIAEVQFAFNAVKTFLQNEIAASEANRQKKEWMAAAAEAKRLEEEKAAKDAEDKKLEEERAAKALEDAKKFAEQKAAKENKGSEVKSAEVVKPREEAKPAAEDNQVAESPSFIEFKNVFAEIISSQANYQKILNESLRLDDVIKQFESEKRGRSILGSTHTEFFTQNNHLVTQSDNFLNELKALENVLLDKGASEEAIIIKILNGVDAIYRKHIPAMADAFVKSAELMSTCNNKLARHAKDYALLTKREPSLNKTPFSSIAIGPVQRGPRLELLANALLKAAGKTIADFKNKYKYTFLDLTHEQILRVNEALKAPKKKANPLARLFAKVLHKTIVLKEKEVKSVIESTAPPQKAEQSKNAEKPSELAAKRAEAQANRAKVEAEHLPAMHDLAKRLQEVYMSKSAAPTKLQNAVRVLPTLNIPSSPSVAARESTSEKSPSHNSNADSARSSRQSESKTMLDRSPTELSSPNSKKVLPQRPAVKPLALSALINQVLSDSPVSAMGSDSSRKSEPALGIKTQTPPPVPVKKRRASAII